MAFEVVASQALHTFNIIKSTVVSENEITEEIIRAAIKVHKTLGPGLLESAYESCLYYEIFQCGLFVERQKPIQLIYQEVKLECGYRADLVIENKVVVEVKAVECTKRDPSDANINASEVA